MILGAPLAVGGSPQTLINCCKTCLLSRATLFGCLSEAVARGWVIFSMKAPGPLTSDTRRATGRRVVTTRCPRLILSCEEAVVGFEKDQ